LDHINIEANPIITSKTVKAMLIFFDNGKTFSKLMN